MENASFLARASKIASDIYRKMPVKNFPLYRVITGQALTMLKSGIKEEEVVERLQKDYGIKLVGQVDEVNKTSLICVCNDR